MKQRCQFSAAFLLTSVPGADDLFDDDDEREDDFWNCAVLGRVLYVGLHNL
jgi:hypothetical protein